MLPQGFVKRKCVGSLVKRPLEDVYAENLYSTWDKGKSSLILEGEEHILGRKPILHL